MKNGSADQRSQIFIALMPKDLILRKKNIAL